MGAMGRIVALLNQKGGVGKTTVTVNLAAVVADTLGGDPEAPPVLGVSTDPQASMLEWAERVGDALPFDFAQCHDDPAALGKLRQLDQYAHIFVDTPGRLEDEAILQTVLAQADDVIVPLEPEPMSFSPAARSIQRVIDPSGVRWRVLLNNWDPLGRMELLPDPILYRKANASLSCWIVCLGSKPMSFWRRAWCQKGEICIDHALRASG